MTYGTRWLGIRDCCATAEVFLSEAERTAYEASPHPHGEEPGEGDD